MENLLRQHRNPGTAAAAPRCYRGSPGLCPRRGLRVRSGGQGAGCSQGVLAACQAPPCPLSASPRPAVPGPGAASPGRAGLGAGRARGARGPSLREGRAGAGAAGPALRAMAPPPAALLLLPALAALSAAPAARAAPRSIGTRGMAWPGRGCGMGWASGASREAPGRLPAPPGPARSVPHPLRGGGARQPCIPIPAHPRASRTSSPSQAALALPYRGRGSGGTPAPPGRC